MQELIKDLSIVYAACTKAELPLSVINILSSVIERLQSQNSGNAIVMRAEGRTVAFIPTDDYINELWEERNSSGTYLEGNLCRRDGAKFIRDLMLKGNGA